MTAIPNTDWSEYNSSPNEIVCKSTQIVIHKKTRDNWKTEQESDPIIGPVRDAIKNKTSNTTGFSDESGRLFQNRSHLLFHCGLLYRKVLDGQLHFSLCYLNLIGNNPWKLVMTIWVTWV